MKTFKKILASTMVLAVCATPVAVCLVTAGPTAALISAAVLVAYFTL